MTSKYLRAIALRVVYHIQQKPPDLHGQRIRTLVMMVSAFIAAKGLWLSEMGRRLADGPGKLDQKVKRMSRFLCRSEFDLNEAFETMAQRVIECVAHTDPKRMILVALDWTDLGKYMGLWLSLPYHGRAIPLACRVLEKEKALGSMTGEEEELLRRFLERFPQEIRDRIAILADRGFAKTELLEVIRKAGAHWAIRLPRNHHVRIDGAWVALEELPMEPGGTRILREVAYTQEAAFPCHVAIRRLRVGEAKDPKDDTWYVATDVQDIVVALTWYEARFQIDIRHSYYTRRLRSPSSSPAHSFSSTHLTLFRPLSSQLRASLLGRRPPSDVACSTPEVAGAALAVGRFPFRRPG